MITVSLMTQDLLAAEACPEGHDLFETISSLAGTPGKLRVIWTPVVDLWLRVAYPDFAAWLYRAGLVPPIALCHLDGRGADLRGAYLAGADLDGVHLRGADLRGARLMRASLIGADLGGADLRGAVLTWADLTGALLDGANLRGASLCGADLFRADLTRALTAGAYLHGAHLGLGDFVPPGWRRSEGDCLAPISPDSFSKQPTNPRAR